MKLELLIKMKKTAAEKELNKKEHEIHKRNYEHDLNSNQTKLIPTEGRYFVKYHEAKKRNPSPDSHQDFISLSDIVPGGFSIQKFPEEKKHETRKL